MSVTSLSLIVSLAAFAASLMVARLFWRPLQRAASGLAREGRCGPGDLLLVRLAPVTTALVVVGVLVVPAFVLFEPRGRTETAGLPIVALAALGAALVGLAIWRAARALQATRALTREWLAVATPLVRPGLAIPAFVVDVPYPLVAATGIVRPRLFISARVLSACGDEELNAILAHEAGHLAGRDNLCRFLIRACPDTLRRGRHERALDRAWSAAAERAADRFALERGVAGVDLASSLLAVARTGRTPALGALASAFLEDDDLERRVRSALAGPAYRQPPAWIRGLRPSGLVLLVLAAALAVTPGALSSIHELVELGVGFLR
jgi:hypothetical protein